MLYSFIKANYMKSENSTQYLWNYVVRTDCFSSFANLLADCWNITKLKRLIDDCRSWSRGEFWRKWVIQLSISCSTITIYCIINDIISITCFRRHRTAWIKFLTIYQYIAILLWFVVTIIVILPGRSHMPLWSWALLLQNKTM
jgi:hypothetical protein